MGAQGQASSPQNITQGGWAIDRLCRKSFQSLVLGWAWPFSHSAQLQELVSLVQACAIQHGSHRLHVANF